MLACLLLTSASIYAQQSGGATKIKDAWCKCDGEIRLWMDGCGTGMKYMFAEGDALDKNSTQVVLEEGTRTSGQSAYRSFTVSGLCPGTYIYSMSISGTMIDGKAVWRVVKVVTVVIEGPEKYLEASAMVINGNCLGEGVAVISATGGNGSNTSGLQWWNEAKQRWVDPIDGEEMTGNAATKLRNGRYRVKVTDSKGCFVFVEFTISGQGGPVAFDVDAIGTPCTGEGTGSASIVNVTGTSDYSVTWSHSSSTSTTVTGLAPGEYSVTVVDKKTGCKTTKTFIIKQRNPVTARAIVRQSGCEGQNSGRIEIVDVKAKGNVKYTWTPNVSSGNLAENLAPGRYRVKIVDEDGCEWEQEILIVDAPEVDLSIATKSYRDVLGICKGRATAIVSSGTPPYTYNWISPSGCSGASCVGDAPGTYTLEVIDANGCRQTQSVIIECKASRIVRVTPVPFDNALTVMFEVPTPSMVDFKLYDVNFNIVGAANLGALNAGMQTQQLVFAGLPQGTYFLNLVLNGMEEPDVVPVVKH